MSTIKSKRCYKVLALGDGEVGKTCLLHRLTNRPGIFKDNEILQQYIPTIFEHYSYDLLYKIGFQSSEKIKTYQTVLWDSAGQEELNGIRRMSYDDVDLVLLCFNLNNIDSFKNIIDRWLIEIGAFLPSTKIILIGTKSDLDKNIEQNSINQLIINSKIEARATGRANKMVSDYVETSSKMNYNFDLLREKMAVLLEEIEKEENENESWINRYFGSLKCFLCGFSGKST